MSGQEFDTAALVRVLGSTELAIVNAALEELGLLDEPEMEAAVAVLEELDDEIRLLRRYRVTQENSLQGLFTVLETLRLDLLEVLVILARIPLNPVAEIKAMFNLLQEIIRTVQRGNLLGQTNAKATRLAEAKLGDLVETRGKIALILL